MQKKIAKALSHPEVTSATSAMADITGLPFWLCRNVMVWRFIRGLSIRIAREARELPQ